MLLAAQTQSIVILAALAAYAASAAGASSPALTLTISLSAGADLSPKLISLMTAETDAIWRQANVTLLWRRETVPPHTSTRWISAPLSEQGELRAIVDNAVQSETEAEMPLGWIVFVSRAGERPLPEAEIHVSSASARAIMTNSAGVLGRVQAMPQLQREMLLARAMGRALAHELGHYLLTSKAHSKKGLMQASYHAIDLFGIGRGGFEIDAAQRQQIADRFLLVHQLAGR